MNVLRFLLENKSKSWQKKKKESNKCDVWVRLPWQHGDKKRKQNKTNLVWVKAFYKGFSYVWISSHLNGESSKWDSCEWELIIKTNTRELFCSRLILKMFPAFHLSPCFQTRLQFEFAATPRVASPSLFLYPLNQALHFALFWVEYDAHGCITVRSRLHEPMLVSWTLASALWSNPSLLVSDESRTPLTSQLSVDQALRCVCIYKFNRGLLTWPRQTDKVKKSILPVDTWPIVIVFYLNMWFLICYTAMTNWYYLESVSWLDSK